MGELNKLFISAILISVGIAFSGCSESNGKKDTSIKEKSKPVKEEVKKPPLNDMLDAVVRAHPNSLKVCYDQTLNLFMMYYGPPVKAGETPEPNRYYGWIALQDLEFFEMSNKTWFITSPEEKKYINLSPDIKNLPCKDTPPL